ncbi:hypothetical protein [Halobellus captivus]|uniref:hypothetical protein n=1 Tax=Halobellus captivus TaxID=2592614 RepID=UPI00193A608D|nr:hypothetical protein [Halobellus captivus]
MPSRRPFIDAETGSVDRNQVLLEAVPLAKLVLFFVAVAAIPFALVYFLFGSSPVGAVLAVVGQFVLAIGTGVVLIYIVVRGIDLAGGPRHGEEAERSGRNREHRPEQPRSDGDHFDGNEQEAERTERERRDPDSEARGSER